MQCHDCNGYYSTAMVLFRTIFILETIVGDRVDIFVSPISTFLFLAIRENIDRR